MCIRDSLSLGRGPRGEVGSARSRDGGLSLSARTGLRLRRRASRRCLQGQRTPREPRRNRPESTGPFLSLIHICGRRVRWGIAGFIAGLVILILCFSTSVLLGLVGVALMFISAVVIERNARLMGRASWQDITRPSQGDDTRANYGPRTSSLRDWLSRQRLSLIHI